jgi:hypothetical protein
MRILRAGTLVALACFAYGAEAAAGDKILGPQSSAADLRAAHPASVPATKLVFDFQTEGQAGSASLTAEVADEFLHIVQTRIDTIYDFKLRRMLVLESALSSFQNVSLYAGVAFRAYEVRNRTYLAQILRAAGAGKLPPTLDPMWSESELGAINPGQARPTIDQETDPSGAIRFFYRRTEVARFVPSPTLLPKTDLTRLLRTTTALHPFIVEAIAATGHVPATLTYTHSSVDELKKVALSLHLAEEALLDYPLPAGFQAAPLPPDVPRTLVELLPVMLDALAGRIGTGPRSIAIYDDSIREALSKGAKFQAMLLAMEANLQHGGPSPGTIWFKEVINGTRGDPRVDQFWHAMSAQAQDPRGQLKTLRGIDASDISNAYVLDDFMANDISATGDEQDPLPLFQSAIRGNPYMAGYYKDFCDHLYRGLRMDLAWLCYDFARTVPGHERAPLPLVIDRFEEQIRGDYPAYF